MIGCSHSNLRRDADGDPIGTSQSTNDAKRAMAIRTVNTGRQAEGLPPLKKPRVHLLRGTGESSNDPVESSIPGDDDLYTDCYWSSEVPNDEILFVNKSTNTIVWSRLTENEKSLFDDAKDKALLKYINRNAWRPVKRVTSNPKKTCPIVFVLKWKTERPMRVCVCKVSNTKTRPPSRCTRNRPRCLELGGRLSFWFWYTSGGKRLQLTQQTHFCKA